MGYNTFIGKVIGGVAPNGYKKIRCHMIYDVKRDGRHKVWLVTCGNLTNSNTESVYSGGVSLCGIRLILFLAEFNDLEVRGANVGNAYLEALTKEKFYIIGCPEFGDLEGHTLLIFKALYGLQSSGLCWHQHFANVLRYTGFVQSNVKSDN
jgi:Reverse transcriptase (RNA-dependent DNA polymerase)